MRYHTLDSLRGLALVNMIGYHFCYDLRYLYRLPLSFMDGRSGFCWQQAICWTFILVSGASFSLSRHPARRGAGVFCCGMLLTAVTLAVMPQQRIIFGVLHLLGCAMLLTALLRPYLSRIPPCAGAVGSFLLFWGSYWLSAGRLFGVQIFDPQGVSGNLLAPLGIYGPGFYSSDYFPLLPWYFLFLCGGFLFALLRRREEGRLLALRVPLLAAAGRHTLPVYLVHQPVLLGVCLILLGQMP